jgi:hypothetical protein
MSLHPPQARIVHPLPAAPAFLGREAELKQMHAPWQRQARGVLALVGLGGAGKTALAARFLSDLLPIEDQRPSGGLFVWSFYQEPDAGLFLRELFDYFSVSSAPAKGVGLLHLLNDALQEGGRHLLVLDGLERVQRQEGAGDGFGQIEDPLLKRLLVRLAEGLGRTMVVVTSRFPLADLTPWAGKGYHHLDVGELSLPAALALLRRRGVHGDDATLTALVEAYGAHALTLDHLGSLIGQFLDGDPLRAPEVPALAAPSGDRQALRLTRLLRAYETHLPPVELALLSRLCLLRRSVRKDQLLSLFLCSPPVHSHTVRGLTKAVSQLLHAKTPGVEAKELAREVAEALEENLGGDPLAGPEQDFRRDVLSAAARVMELHTRGVYFDMEDLARRYAKTPSDGPTDQHPLGKADRAKLHTLYARYSELRQHPLMNYKEPDPLLNEAFVNLGWSATCSWTAGDLGPSDIFRGFARVKKQLSWLATKHLLLGRIRELCRVHRQKWALAGPLAPLSAAELQQVIETLVARHLVLWEADGAFTAHPAVRDHFAQVGRACERGRLHDLLRGQLVSLVSRPGLRHPEDRVTLDLVEEAIYHALEAGQKAEAENLYEQILGGLRHLGWKLGEMARGLRILRGFASCPDRWALAWFLRALGELEEAYRNNDLPYFRADIRLLQGRLPEVAGLGEPTRTAVAEFLMGRTTQPPPSVLGCAVPRAQLLLYLGRLTQARQIAELDPLYHDMGRETDRARGQLIAAEAARRQNDLMANNHHLVAASQWILHAGSVEHLCLYHLLRARVAGDLGDQEGAQRAVNEGLHLSRACGLGLAHIELLCLQAEINLARGDAPAAEQMASDALWRATADDCRFAWGEAEARHLLGKALLVQQRRREAQAALETTMELRQHIGDPRQVETASLLASLIR